MKPRLILFLAALGMGILPASAQLTTGTPSSKVIRTGNRAQAGDFGIYLGATSNMFKDIFDNDVKLSALPLINFKYMASDKLETRLGIELYKSSERLKGDVITPTETGNTTHLLDDKYANSQAMFYPGIAYHFSSRNLLDVYIGAELPLGWNSDRTLRESHDSSSSITKTSFVIGVGAFIGLQAYIANLPLAIGIEYGVSSRFDTGLKYKNEMTVEGETQTYYSPDLENFAHLSSNERFDKLKAKRGEIGNQFRLTLTYYFK